jgi:hypothetical protein
VGHDVVVTVDPGIVVGGPVVVVVVVTTGAHSRLVLRNSIGRVPNWSVNVCDPIGALAHLVL